MENDLIFGSETSDMLTGDAADGVQIAAATATGEPYPDALAVPIDAAQVEIPQGENIVRVPVQPGEVIELPFPADSQFLAREDNGNLAIKVGDITVILQGYVEAAGQTPPVIEASNGQPLDIATILASTDPNIDIQTAAGPAAGPQGQGADNTGGILQQFGPGAGLGGFEGAGALDATDGLGGGTVDQTGTLFRQFGLLTNAAPIAQDDTLKTNEDTPISGQVVAVDPEGDALTYAVVGGLPAGVTFGADGSWAFDPTTLKEYQELDDGDSLTISFQYNATDGANTSNTATVTIDVAGVNDAPVAPDYTLKTNEDTKIDGQVVATDVDKNDTLTYTLVGALPPGVTFDPATGKWAFDPTGIKEYQELNVGGSKQISFEYKASDGTTESVGKVTIDVDGVNDAPQFLGGTVGNGNNPPRWEDAADSYQDLNWVIVDKDDAPGSYTITVDPATLPPGVSYDAALGRLILKTAGHYDYLAAGQTQDFVIKFTITDAHGASIEQDYTLTMGGNNDTPIAVSDTIINDASTPAYYIPQWVATLNDTDANGDPLFVNDLGGFKGTGKEDLLVPLATPDPAYTVTDGHATSAPATVHFVHDTDGIAGTVTGTDGNDIMVGDVNASQQMLGGKGDDVIVGYGGAHVFGGQGDDTLIFASVYTASAEIHGEEDTVAKTDGLEGGAAMHGDILAVADLKLNFADHASVAGIDGIETISTQSKVGGFAEQVAGVVGQAVTIGAQSVQDISDHTITPGGLFPEKDAVRVDGDAIDQLYLSISKDGGNWTDTGVDANGYHVFAHETTGGDPTTTDAYVMVQSANVANVHLNQDAP
jgi:VCBS repeat-containing protein